MPNSISSPGVAVGSNRLNSSGIALTSATNQQSQFWTSIIPANSTVPLSLTGSSFIVTYASGPIAIRPNGGIFNTYATGTGLKLLPKNAFARLEIQNAQSVPALVQVFIGFDEFVDNRLILDATQFPSVVYPTYPTANAAASVAITDRSGQAFTDINGGAWYAVSRLAIIISNIDTGVTLLLQKAAAATASGPSIAAIPPVTSLNYPAAGNYSLSVGGGNINAIVSEIYQALPRT